MEFFKKCNDHIIFLEDIKHNLFIALRGLKREIVCVCVCEVRGGVAVCTVDVERFELQQGEGVCEPTASSRSLIPLSLALSLFLIE